ncbi:hypothetical protein J6590_104324 [Homalodisca vitripennis]|nr:hypothetical protein J6590_104324 [Homalodisca vitripennis]
MSKLCKCFVLSFFVLAVLWISSEEHDSRFQESERTTILNFQSNIQFRQGAVIEFGGMISESSSAPGEVRLLHQNVPGTENLSRRPNYGVRPDVQTAAPAVPPPPPGITRLGKCTLVRGHSTASTPGLRSLVIHWPASSFACFPNCERGLCELRFGQEK